MIKVTGISRVVWKYAKSNFKFDTYEELLAQLNSCFADYLDWECNFTEKEVVGIVVGAYTEYAKHGIPQHLSKYMFNHIIGDPIVELVYGEDHRSLNQRIIEGIIIAIRNSQVCKEHGVKLIDYGQA